MSDTSAPTQAPPPPPLNLSPFAVPAPSDAALRYILQAIGAQLSVQMMNAKMTPEEVATKTALPQDLVYQIMVGIEPNIGVSVLSDLAKLFGMRLSIQFHPPVAPVPPTAS